MKRKTVTAVRKDGTIYYAWTKEEMAAKLKHLVALYTDARKCVNLYRKAKEKNNQREMISNKRELLEIKEKIENLKNELRKEF